MKKNSASIKASKKLSYDAEPERKKATSRLASKDKYEADPETKKRSK